MLAQLLAPEPEPEKPPAPKFEGVHAEAVGLAQVEEDHRELLEQ